MTPFEWIKHINEKTKAEFDSSYNSFLVNRGLSFSQDNIFFSNEMNNNYSLDADIQKDFYFYFIPKNKKFTKWIKKEIGGNEELLELLMKHFRINRFRAEEFLQILSAEQIEIIKTKMGVGGTNGKKMRN